MWPAATASSWSPGSRSSPARCCPRIRPATLLHPVVDTCRRQLAEAGIQPRLRTMLAGSGYLSEDNFARAGADGPRLLAPPGKDPATRRAGTPAGHRDLARLPATARAVRRMRHHRGHAEDKFRAQTVDPVTGQIKTGQAMTIMSRRRFGACRSHWLPAATAPNLRQLHAHRRDTEHRTHTTGRDNRDEATTGPATHPRPRLPKPLRDRLNHARDTKR